MSKQEQELARTGNPEDRLRSKKTIYVDEAGKQIKIDDEIISFSKHEIPWRVFLLLASDTQVYVSSGVIKGLEIELGSKTKNPAVKSIGKLRDLTHDLETRSLILMRGSSVYKNIEYKLNANVVFVEESEKAKFFPEELKFPLNRLQLKAAYAFFALNKKGNNKEGTDYKFPSVSDLRAKVFNDEFKNKLTPKEKKEIMRIRFGPDFQRERINFISWLEKLMLELSLPLEKLSPETRKFKHWFDSIPVYKGLSVDDLVSIVKRKIPFKQLKKLKEQKEALSP